MECVSNQVSIQDMGSYFTTLQNNLYNSPKTVDHILRNLHSNVRKAVTEFNPNDPFLTETSCISVVIKQLMAYKAENISAKEAGALTNATVHAFKSHCDDIMGPDSTISTTRSKHQG